MTYQSPISPGYSWYEANVGKQALSNIAFSKEMLRTFERVQIRNVRWPGGAPSRTVVGLARAVLHGNGEEQCGSPVPGTAYRVEGSGAS